MKFSLETKIIKPENKSVKSAIILLHGYGGDGNDISAITLNWKRFLPETIFLCPNAHEVCSINPNGFQWFDLDKEDPDYILEESIKAEKKLNFFINEIKSEYKLSNSEIHLWFVDHQDFDEVELKNKCLSWLSEEELDRLNRYIFRRHQKQFLLGRMLIRRALSQYSDVSPQHWRLADNHYGKLFLEPSHKESLFFNLSHAGDRLVLAISRVDQLGCSSLVQR